MKSAVEGRGGRLESFTRAMIRWRYAVAVAWIVAIAASAVAALQLSSLLSNRFLIPNSDAQRVEDIMRSQYGELSDGIFSIVVTSQEATPQELELAANQAAARAWEAVRVGTVRPARLIDKDVAVASIVTKLEQADGKAKVAPMREAIGAPQGFDVYLAGQGAFAADLDPVLADDLKKGELSIAMPIALLILLFVFGSLGAIIPFLFAVAAIPVTLGVVYLFALNLDLSSYVLNMVVGVGLGVSIDYCLLMYYRYREERMRDGEDANSPEARTEAIVRTMLTAGRAVVFSGTAVAIGLAVLLLMPLPFMQGFGLAGLIIPLVAIAASLTLMPGVLYMMAHRLERYRFMSVRYLRSRDDYDRSFWARLARAIMRRPLPAFMLSAGILIALAVPALQLEMTPGSDAGVPRSIESVRGLDIIKESLGPGGATPIKVVIDSGRDGGTSTPDLQAAAARLAKLVGSDSGAKSVTPITVPGAISSNARYAVMQVSPRHDYGDPRSGELVERIRSEHVAAAKFPAGVDALVGGAPGIGVDLIDTAYSSFPLLVAGVLVLTFLLLMRAFRSLLLPIKAIILNLLSIGAAYGLLVLVFTTPVASAVGLQPADQIEFWIPVFMFAMLFGLSMDYEVFLVSRMREEWDAEHNNEHAVAMGLARTGRLVTAAGMIMVVAFAGFMLSSPVGFQQFGLGLASAILIDVTIVRALLLPSAMRLFGKWNWWLPRWMAVLVRVEPSPLHPDRAREQPEPSLQHTEPVA
jgi:uncharacterized membrane protein YdfJ with MMPL/SSD domain